MASGWRSIIGMTSLQEVTSSLGRRSLLGQAEINPLISAVW